MAHVHTAASHARAAVAASAPVHLHTDDIKAIEQAIDRSQRADEATEGAVAEHAGQGGHQHDYELAGEQDPQHTEITRVDRRGIGQQTHCAFKGAGRTDVLAEARQRQVIAQAVQQR